VSDREFNLEVIEMWVDRESMVANAKTKTSGPVRHSKFLAFSQKVQYANFDAVLSEHAISFEI
jgi:hypothetical protein